MVTSYLPAGYQELRNSRSTSEVSLQQGVIASTHQAIYGMFTEGLGINMLQEDRCCAPDTELAAWKAVCHIPLVLLATGASETSRKQEQVTL